jgi:lipoprotein-releasing system ATP-binding protein
MKCILRARNIRKRFATDLLNGIDLDLHAGEAIAIVGASGEGKSTLLHILATLEPATEGQIEIGGQPVEMANAASIRNEKLGILFQAYHLLEEESALTNVLMPAWIGRFRTQSHQKSKQHARQLLERVGLGHRIDYPVKLLSGGEKQRVALARSLCNRPLLLLADEPTGNLDHATSAQIHQLLLEGVRQDQHGLLVVTHDMELAALCDRTYQLRDGKLIQ